MAKMGHKVAAARDHALHKGIQSQHLYRWPFIHTFSSITIALHFRESEPDDDTRAWMRFANNSKPA
jgi:hypothetical protein